MSRYILILFIFLSLISCTRRPEYPDIEKITISDSLIISKDSIRIETHCVVLNKDLKVKDYFSFLDSVISQHPGLAASQSAENILVLHNAWIIDSLRNLDYYTQKSKGRFQYDLAEEIILHKADTLQIPDHHAIDSISKKLGTIRLDVNIPEYKLRVIQSDDTLFTFKVRVGRNSEEYLESVGRVVNQRTPIGTGKIIRVIKNPVYLNLQTGKKYEETKRDDGRYTRMPAIPSLEPVINGTRYGTMFHATTNKKTLGKAFSNGCVGLREADMWTLYYYATAGTAVQLRYDLKIVTKNNDTITLKDIYQYGDSLRALSP